LLLGCGLAACGGGGSSETSAQGSGTESPANPAQSTGVTTDNQPPSMPGSPILMGATTTTAQLSWSAATDNVGIAGYDILRDGRLLSQVPATVLTYMNSGLTAGASYSFSVRAYDANGNYSLPSPALVVVLPTSGVSGSVSGSSSSSTSSSSSSSGSTGGVTKPPVSSSSSAIIVELLVEFVLRRLRILQLILEFFFQFVFVEQRRPGPGYAPAS
jgi:hypothetical protein